LPTPRLLIADDTPPSLRFFAEALGALAHCTLACDGGEAVRLALAGRFDLLLLDARMPVLGGAAVLAMVRGSEGPSRAAPALATTADADPHAHARLRAAGFDAVLPKPTGVAALRATVARHLPAVAAEAAGAIDDAGARAAAGGDARIVAALRGLLAGELDALPGELAAISARGDRAALGESLHRLDASAGFCGVPGLAHAVALLRRALAARAPEWPQAAVERFLADVAALRRLLPG
jgi:CheY-like chemotaxis protein